MTLTRNLFWTFLIQGVGALSVLLTSIVVARWYGAEVFGWFSSAKSWVLFLMAVGCLGLSQGVLDALNRRVIPPQVMVSLIACYGAAFMLLVLLLNASGVISFILSDRFSSLELLLMCVSGGLFVFHTLYRFVLLSSDKTLVYNVVTMLPNALIFVLIIGWFVLGYTHVEHAHFVFIFCVSLSLSLCFTLWHIVRDVGVSYSLRGVSASAYKTLMTNSLMCSVPPIIQMLIPAMSFYILTVNSGANLEAAYLGVGFVLLSIVLMVFNMGSPIVFNQWSKSSDAMALKTAYATFSRISSLMGVLVLVLAYALVPMALQLLYGSAMQAATQVCVVLVASSIIWMHAKVLMTVCLSKSLHGHLALACLLKALVFFCFVMHQRTAYDVSVVWVLIETLFMLYLMCVVVFKRYVSIPNLFGLR